MTEHWLAIAIGAGSGAALLALFARLPERQLAMQGFIVFAVMLWIYFGARLVSATDEQILYEGMFALVAGAIAQGSMLKWPPAIGIAIFLHGIYDAVIGPHTGVADWYPPLCAGFDLVVGTGLFLVLLKKRRENAS